VRDLTGPVHQTVVYAYLRHNCVMERITVKMDPMRRNYVELHVSDQSLWLKTP